MKKFCVLLLLAFSFQGFAQDERVITTAVPFLRIAADARSSAIGDIGVASSVDVFSQQWNPAKFAFAERKWELGLATHLI